MVSKITFLTMAAAASSGFLPTMAQQPAYEIARCGPFFDNLGCPTNADGLGTVQFCSKWGFCGTDQTHQDQQAAGYYVSVDQQCNVNSDCSVNGTICDNIEGRCAMADVDAATFTPTFGSGNVVVPVTGATQAPVATQAPFVESGGSSSVTTTQAPVVTQPDNAESSASSLNMFGGLFAGVAAVAVVLF